MTDFFYNLTNLTKANNTAVDVARYVNEVTGGVFWIATVFVFWIILFVALVPFGERKALLSSTFSVAIYSYLLAAMGLMDVTFSLLPTIALVFIVLINVLSEGK